MKIKNSLIIALVQAGCLNIASNTPDSATAYTLVKNRKALREAYSALQDGEKELLDECKLTVNEKGEPEGKELDRFKKLQSELFNDEMEVNLLPLPYDVYHSLKANHKVLADPIIEDALEGILWE